jgi:hypothetical protein
VNECRRLGALDAPLDFSLPEPAWYRDELVTEISAAAKILPQRLRSLRARSDSELKTGLHRETPVLAARLSGLTGQRDPVILGRQFTVGPNPLDLFVGKKYFLIFGIFRKIGILRVGHMEYNIGNPGIGKLHCIILFFFASGRGSPELQLPFRNILVVEHCLIE